MSDAIHLSAAEARVEDALESVRAAITGYVALNAAPERAGTTAPLFEHLDTALTALTSARTEANRLIGNLA